MVENITGWYWSRDITLTHLFPLRWFIFSFQKHPSYKFGEENKRLSYLKELVMRMLPHIFFQVILLTFTVNLEKPKSLWAQFIHGFINYCNPLPVRLSFSNNFLRCMYEENLTDIQPFYDKQTESSAYPASMVLTNFMHIK